MSAPLYSQHHYTMKPTRITLFFRQCVLYQLFRFLIVNIRMTLMIFKSHDSSIKRLPASPAHPVSPAKPV